MPLLEQIASWLTSAGPLGLFLAAILDAFLPMTGVVDTMVVFLSYAGRDPVTFALLATVGSVAGYALLFCCVRLLGDSFVGRFLSPARRARLEAALDRFGVPLVAIGGLLPPPFPLKGLVLSAGLGRMRLVLFAVGLFLARLFRYGMESTLAVIYGDRALELMKHYYVPAGLIATFVILAVWLVSRRLLRAPHTPASAESTSA